MSAVYCVVTAELAIKRFLALRASLFFIILILRLYVCPDGSTRCALDLTSYRHDVIGYHYNLYHSVIISEFSFKSWLYSRIPCQQTKNINRSIGFTASSFCHTGLNIWHTAFGMPWMLPPPTSILAALPNVTIE